MMNLRELRRNPSPYVLPVIPHPLPSEIEKGEHYVIADLLNLALGSSSPTQTYETEVVGRELVINIRPEQPFLAREDSGPAPHASKRVDMGSRLEGFPFAKKDSWPAPQAFKKGRRVPERLRAPGGGVEDFVSWVVPVSSHPLASEEEEEEDEMVDLAHNFGTRKRKRGTSFKRAIDATPKVVGVRGLTARVRMGRQ